MVRKLKIDKDKLSPMMREYVELKEKNQDAIVMYRIGDFFEMFFDDAIEVSELLDLVLTGRDCGLDERAPMCGVPAKAVDFYINKLGQMSKKVVIVDQVEDPRLAQGLVKRDIVKIVTPGTSSSGEELNKYIIYLYIDDMGASIVKCDYLTGDIDAHDYKLKSSVYDIVDSIFKYNVAEVFINDDYPELESLIKYIGKKSLEYVKTYKIDNNLDDIISILKENHNINLKKNDYRKVIAIYYLISYLEYTQKNDLKHFKFENINDDIKTMILDDQTRLNLEIDSSYNTKSKTLFDILNDTKTAMGLRYLKNAMLKPLINASDINERLDLVEYFYKNEIEMTGIRNYLKNIRDVDRISNRINEMTVTKQDMLRLKDYIIYSENAVALIKDENIRNNFKFFALDDIVKLIDIAIDSMDSDYIIKLNYNSELDKYRSLQNDSLKEILLLEDKDRKNTKIKNLKIKYNKILGYFYEVTKSNLNMVPDYFIKRATLVNSERFITEELKALETEILTAKDKFESLEKELFNDIKNKLLDSLSRIKNLSEKIAYLDFIVNLAYIARKNKYVRASISDDNLVLKNSRHPVIEKNLKDTAFIENDAYFDTNKYIKVITGPNMSGKSTYMRQIAISLYLNQIGSFVPASEAKLPIVDRIFTRIGASDDISRGNSTFMVEMKEVNEILKFATKDSFIVLDEVGRGTSTNDGLSIAFAILEYISKKIKAKTIFSTHYHEIPHLTEGFKNVEQISMDILEDGEDLIFLRKIKNEAQDKSYGIYVAKLSGINDDVISSAQEMMDRLEYQDLSVRKKEKESTNISLDEYKYRSYVDSIKAININSMTPMDALNELNKIIEKAKKIGD